MDKTQFEARMARAKANKEARRKAEILDKVVEMLGINRSEDLPQSVASLHETIDRVLLTMFTEAELKQAHFLNKVALLGKMPGRIEALRASLTEPGVKAAGFEDDESAFDHLIARAEEIGNGDLLTAVKQLNAAFAAVSMTQTMQKAIEEVRESQDIPGFLQARGDAVVEPTARPRLAGIAPTAPKPPVLPMVAGSTRSHLVEASVAHKPADEAKSYRVVLDRTDIQSGDSLNAIIENAPDYAEVDWNISQPKVLTGTGGNYRAGNVNHATKVIVGAVVWVDGIEFRAESAEVTIHPKKNGKTNGVPPLVKGSDDVLRPRTGQAPAATNNVRRFIEE